MLVRSTLATMLAVCLAACGQDAPDDKNLPTQGQASEGAESVSARTDGSFSGLWKGTLGKQAILSCFDEGGLPVGVYYYMSHLKPIALQHDDDAPQDGLVEMTGFDDPTGGRWVINSIGDKTISGEWTDGKKSLPIELTRQEFSGGEDSSVCESPEFVGPRSGGGKVAKSTQTFAGQQFTRLDYQPGKQFAEDSVSVRSFAIAEEQSGDAAINRALRSVLPDGSPNSDLMDCMGLSVSMRGWDGDFQSQTEPELITDQWIGAVSSSGTYCGGAHPNYRQERQVFDRTSGEEVDPSRWLKPGLLTFYEVRESGPARAKRVIETIDAKLLALVVKNWPEGDSECVEALPGFFGYDLGLVRAGIIFKPEVPHVATPCAEPITISWAELDPYLSPEGQRVRASLR